MKRVRTLRGDSERMVRVSLAKVSLVMEAR
jgi:hypothetical protein